LGPPRHVPNTRMAASNAGTASRTIPVRERVSTTATSGIAAADYLAMRVVAPGRHSGNPATSDRHQTKNCAALGQTYRSNPALSPTDQRLHPFL